MRNLISSLLLMALALGAKAQKLPGTQTESVSAPKNIKVDGKPTEWLQFQAYNNAIECFYTLSNDTDNLYLAVQATDHGIIQKIAAGGITLTMRSIDKKLTAAPVSITYPLIPPMYGQGISYTLRTNKTLSDKQLAELNTNISGHIKEIPFTGAKGVTDSVISIYNDLGIKAAGQIDRQKAYTCELAIPLKYIEQVLDATGKFKYRIQVNGMDTSGKDGIIVVGGVSIGASEAPVSHDNSSFLLSPTYLQGIYTLAK